MKYFKRLLKLKNLFFYTGKYKCYACLDTGIIECGWSGAECYPCIYCKQGDFAKEAFFKSE